MSRKLSIVKRVGIVFAVVILVGYLVPERLVIPVENATTSDWNKDTFWHEPWGASGVHKGIDIFAPKGRHVLAATGVRDPVDISIPVAHGFRNPRLEENVLPGSQCQAAGSLTSGSNHYADSNRLNAAFEESRQ